MENILLLLQIMNNHIIEMEQDIIYYQKLLYKIHNIHNK